MGTLVGIVGRSGHGKSTSIEGLDPTSTAIINVVGKPLPFMGWKKNFTPVSPDLSEGNYIRITNHLTASNNIVTALNTFSQRRPDIKEVVVDDYQYIMSYEYMKRAKQHGWDKFTDIGIHAFNILEVVSYLRDDMKVYILAHLEDKTSGMDSTKKIKTIGKLLDEKITLEGLFTVVLFCDPDTEERDLSKRFRFITVSDGVTTAKSPKGMFPEYIPNNLGVVSKRIDEYYEGITLEQSSLFKDSFFETKVEEEEKEEEDSEEKTDEVSANDLDF